MSDIRCYVSGPMTGHPDHNFPAFHAAEAALRAAYPDAEILNPAKHFDGRTDLPRSTYMRADIADLLRATHIYMLKGWSSSRGAALEFEIACELDLQIVYAPDAERDQSSAPRTILEEAAHVVDGPRREAYGHPMNNHARTAKLWSAYLGHPVTPRQVCWCMILTKASRDANRPGRDHLVDTAGYARNIEMIEEEARRHESPE